QLRQQDRRRRAKGHPERPESNRSLSRGGCKAVTMLSVHGLRAGYGKSEVLRDVSTAVEQGQIVPLIGANGAGKTTLLKTISGLIRPSAGTIRFEGQNIARMAAHKITGRGTSHVPEGRAILKRMTVIDNLRMG